MMDTWQKHVLDKCSAFVAARFEYEENEIHISLNKREAYVVMKILKDLELNEIKETQDAV